MLLYLSQLRGWCQSVDSFRDINLLIQSHETHITYIYLELPPVTYFKQVLESQVVNFVIEQFALVKYFELLYNDLSCIR